ncbi:TonB-dependent receptor [Adhaeribacter swui]|uniref:TonB-dependent receptor n=1 Tax=Adhaeribacter swui TaxID=2086471 RepID=A0A7G7GDF2_9BACT|nr:TonB-dependent receptor [Adhaeribacter swui]QNF35186.1 TonB-dependent receptor [Adhaeribacter swui]
MNKLFFTLFFLLLTNLVAGQQKFTISGYIRDAVSGESLIGATIRVQEISNQGSTTNNYGFYSITLPAGSYTILAQYLGYRSREFKVDLKANYQQNILLEVASVQVEEVVISDRKPDEQVKSTQMSQVILPIEQVKTLPVLFGETDILKTVQLLPGIKSGGEGNTGFYVRGGGVDQNLILLDEAVVYNPGHLFNFFSVFNGDAIRNTTVIKGNMPVRYGGRLASVLDISMKEGNKEKLRAEGGVGLIASRLLVEGPLAQQKSSFMVSGRRTYLDVLANPFLKNTEQGGVPFSFYDLNAKVNYTLSRQDRLYLSGYLGNDKGSFDLSDGRFKADFNWGNKIAVARWNHLFSDKLFLNVSAVYNQYRFIFDSHFDNYSSKLDTGVKDASLKVDFDYYPSVRHTLQYGLHYTKHLVTPRTGTAQTDEGVDFSTDRVRRKQVHEAALYLSDDWNLSDRLALNLGLRWSGLRQTGPYTQFNLTPAGNLIDSVTYRANQKVKEYLTLEPRLSFRYSVTNSSSVKGGVSRNAQYLHLVSNAYTALPVDIWVPSSVLVKPQYSWQYTAGLFKNLKENQYEASVEVYYKTLENQLEYRDGYVPGPLNKDLEYEFVVGNGRSYGAEFFVRKNQGKWQGWLGYALARTTRTFPDLNKGKPFPARSDRRHDLSLVSSYKYHANWTLGGTFTYGTGQSVTLPERRYVIEDAVVYQYGARNGFRMQATHRLDVSATYQKKRDGWLQSSWTFAVYNLYGRHNPFFYYIDNEGSPYNNSLSIKAKKVSVFPFPIPSVTWNFSF